MSSFATRRSPRNKPGLRASWTLRVRTGPARIGDEAGSGEGAAEPEAVPLFEEFLRAVPYQLPFGRHSGNRLLKSVIQDWAIAPIFAAHSGLPLEVSDGSCQEFGQGDGGSCTDAVLIAQNTFGHSAHFAVAGNRTTGVGISGDPAAGGSGINLFADPDAVYNSFRPVQISRDTTSRGGVLRGLNRWNFDLNVVRKFLVEHVLGQFL